MYLYVSIYKQNKTTFQSYINSHIKDVEKINSTINNTSLPVYLFGAHVFSQYLISFGLETSKIIKVLDNDPYKHKKRLYGTELRVESPKVLSKEKEAIVILRAGLYNEEVKKDIIENINSNIKFI